MAGHLATHGFRPTVFDQSTDAMERFLEAHGAPDPLCPTYVSEEGEVIGCDPEQDHKATAAASAAAVGEKSDVVFTMLPTGDDVASVYFGAHGLDDMLESWLFPLGILGTDKPSHRVTLVDCSGLGPSTAKEVTAELEEPCSYVLCH